MPCSMARRAAASAASCAANGVDLREPLKPTWPAEAQEITAPVGSVIDTMVLLKVLLMCACPWATFLRSLRRTFLTAVPPARAFGGILYALLDLFSRPDRLLLLLARLLLAGDRALRTLAGAGVGPGALTAHGQALAVPDALVAADLNLAADIRLDLAAQVPFNLEVGLDVVAQLHDLFIGQVTSPLVGVDAGGGQKLDGSGATDAK